MTDTASTDPQQSHTLDDVKFAPWTDWYGHGPKRVLDIALTLALLPAAIPLILVMYTFMRLGGAPGFYGHIRVGRDGNLFTCWKIRTMVPEADDKLMRLLQKDVAAKAEWDRDQKLTKDPRVTPIGHALRISSLDELPQLWNVLRGDMSLVGPRPVTQEELARYGTGQGAYLAMRPGITGLWQVSGRNDVSYEQRVAFDVSYQKSASLRLDLKILMQTLSVLCARTGR